jgi:hypothetical protein
VYIKYFVLCFTGAKNFVYYKIAFFYRRFSSRSVTVKLLMKCISTVSFVR